MLKEMTERKRRRARERRELKGKREKVPIKMWERKFNINLRRWPDSPSGLP